MGLRETFQRLAQTAMNAAGNVPESCTFRRIAYDANGQPTGGYSASVSVKALRQSLSVEKVDGSNILADDRLYILTALDLGGVVPSEDDLLDFGSGVTWTVKRVETDPAGATHTLQVRR